MAFIVHGASAFTQEVGGEMGPVIHQPKAENENLCSTCGDFKAENHDQLKEHYRTEWHRHNLKRKVAGLAPINQADFEVRVAAFMSTAGSERNKKKEHLGKKAREKQAKKEEAQQKRREEAKNQPENAETAGPEETGPDLANMSEEEYMDWRAANAEQLAPGDSFFCRHKSENLSENLEFMAKNYGFFIPFLEHVTDLDGLVEYLGQKLSIGCVCLWCGKSFHSLQAVRMHMVDKAHCKINFEGCEEEYQDFYSIDLAPSNFLQEDDEDEWETDEEEEISGDEFEIEEDEDTTSSKGPSTQGKLAEAARMSRKHAKAVNEVAISSGGTTKVLGHRAFKNYYGQKLRPEMLTRSKKSKENHDKILGLLTNTYQSYGIVAQYKGSSKAAKNNRDYQKSDLRTQHKWWMKVGIRANKFHQVRREDYHA